MGMHRIEITMTGGHGCDRAAKEGEPLKPPCDNPACPDCQFRKLVEEFKTRGCFGYPSTTGADGKSYEHGATLTHWPNQEGGGIVDDLVTGVRKKGQF